jgi:putative transposase
MPEARRIAVSYTVESLGISIRRSCRLVGVCRATYAYRLRDKGDGLLRVRLRELAEQRRRFGCPRLHVMLKRESLVINHKRTERIYREERLSLRLKKRKKKAAVLRVMLPQAEHADQRWSMDFAADSTLARRRFRALAIVDDYSRECPAIEVDSSIPGAKVVDVLERLAETRELPEVITVDNGPEFAGRILDGWAYRRGIKLNFIRPGKPVENAYAESFIGRLRDECLNENWFSSVSEARDIIETWRRDYNEVRPHSSLDNLSPREFIETREKTLINSGL